MTRPCPNCGNETDELFVYCSVCGFDSLEGGDEGFGDLEEDGDGLPSALEAGLLLTEENLIGRVMAGDIRSVKILLHNRVEVDCRDEYGWSPLLFAADRNLYDVASVLLRYGADPNLCNSQKHTPLMRAAFRENKEMVELLLSSGADPGFRAKDGSTALHVAASHGAFEVVQLLFERGVDVDARDVSGKTPLHWAAQMGRTDAVRLLMELKADYRAVDRTQWTALHWAALGGKVKTGELLLAYGVPVNAESDEGLTAIDIASQKMNRDFWFLLKAAGAEEKPFLKKTFTGLSF